MKSSSCLDFLIMIPTHEASCALIANRHNRLFANKTPRKPVPGRLAPRTGFEPVTSRLTAGRSTVELSGKVCSYGQLEYTPIDGGASIGVLQRGAVHYFARSAIWRAWHPQGVPLLYDAGSASDRL